MDLFTNITAQLSVEQLTTLIKQAAEKEAGLVVTKVDFQVETRIQGYGIMEHAVQEFTGAKITFGGPIQLLNAKGFGQPK